MRFLLLLISLGCLQSSSSFTLNNVVWNTPTKEPGTDEAHRPIISGGMPIGNGDTVALVWPNTTYGSIEGYIRKQDAQTPDTAMRTVTHFQIQLQPNPFKSTTFLQQLNLNTATIEIRTDSLTASLRIEATLNQLRLNISSSSSVQATLKFMSVHPSSTYSQKDPFACSSIQVSPDISLDPIPSPFTSSNTIIMYHANPPASSTDYLSRLLKQQGISSIIPQTKNRWGNLHWGVAVSSPAFKRMNPSTLVTTSSTKMIELTMGVATHITSSLSEFLTKLHDVQQAKPAESHLSWWTKFNNRSWIFTPNTQNLTNMYAITRYVQAIQSRGDWPIKFNGELFTANVPGKYTDYRDWGSSNWWQNTRLPYHAMLLSGDVDLMDTLFTYYGQMLPFARARTMKYFNHTGIFFTETKTLFGAFAESDYGCNRPSTYPIWLEDNNYIHLDYGGNAGGPGVAMLILRAYQYTQNETRLKRDLPIVLDSLRFFYNHYPRKNGKLHIYPTQALETYWCPYPFVESNCVSNDQPTVSSLYAIARRVLKLPQKFVTSADRQMTTDLLNILPAIPMKDNVLVAAEYFPSERRNVETPELWPIHPNFMVSVGLNRTSDQGALFNSAVGAWEIAGKRGENRNSYGWNQYGMNAALLGQTKSAWEMVLKRESARATGYRFPGFAPHMQDYQPSADHFANLMSALQYMLLQDGANNEIVLFPAWPCDQDVQAKLYGSLQTVVELSLVKGKLDVFVVTPVSRKKDVIFANCV